MVKRKQSVHKETKADVVDKIVQQVDPLAVAGMSAAAIAGACGVQGPLTRILIGMGNAPAEQLSNPAIASFSIGTIGLIPTLLAGLLSGEGTSGTSQPNDADKAALGAAMSNACEFLLLYKLATNDMLLGQLIGAGKDIASATIRAGGEAVPF